MLNIYNGIHKPEKRRHHEKEDDVTSHPQRQWQRCRWSQKYRPGTIRERNLKDSETFAVSMCLIFPVSLWWLTAICLNLKSELSLFVFRKAREWWLGSLECLASQQSVLEKGIPGTEWMVAVTSGKGKPTKGPAVKIKRTQRARLGLARTVRATGSSVSPCSSFYPWW